MNAACQRRYEDQSSSGLENISFAHFITETRLLEKANASCQRRTKKMIIMKNIQG